MHNMLTYNYLNILILYITNPATYSVMWKEDTFHICDITHHFIVGHIDKWGIRYIVSD